ncbi:MAG TPA: CAP domain-containing protein, partial [Isosphaeraceae bacterium]|nr:CAP domain-containing protein [Isosphaeraceae bacterium]
MTRPKNRRSLRFENLESRNLLSSVGTPPTVAEQYMLELVNQARMYPQAAAERLTSSIDPALQDTLNYYHVDVNEVAQEIASAPAKAPLAWNSDLASAAQAHSQDMANNNFQSHTGSDGSSAQDRMEKAGYTNPATGGENVYAYAKSVDNAMQAFLFDWGVADQGHRRNIQQFNTSANNQYTDVGIGIVSTPVSSSPSTVGPVLVTQDFGSQQNEQPQLVGVAYQDNQHTGLYAMGEGQGGVQIDATNLDTGKTTSTQTWSTGGYQVPLSPGDYKVTASQNGTVIQSVTLTIGSQNAEQDFLLNRPWDGRSVSQVESSITPAKT